MKVILALIISISLITPLNISFSYASSSSYVEGEVLVKFKDPSVLLNVLNDSGDTNLDAPLLKSLDSKQFVNSQLFTKEIKTKFNKISSVFPLKKPSLNKNLNVNSTNQLDGLAKLTFDKTNNVLSVVNELKRDSAIEYVEPNYFVNKHASVPNDPNFGEQWGMYNTGQASAYFDIPNGIAGNDIKILNAWDIKRDSSNTHICIIDDGFGGSLPDYQDSVWKNPRETVNNIDDDGNGYVDDIEGWDFIMDADSGKAGGMGHAYVSMLVIASKQNNNDEMAGISNKSKVADVIVFGIFQGQLSDVIAGVRYSADIGCKILNMSLGTSSYSAIFEDSIKYARDKGALVVASAGNNGVNTDSTPNYPSSFALDNIISVASFNSRGEISSFSNFGVNSVHIGAPGEDIYYYYAGSLRMGSGTSFASPYVTGVASLIWDKNPTWDYKKVKEAVLKGSDTIPSWNSKIQNGRRLNAYKALTYNPNSIIYDINNDGHETLSDVVLHLGYIFNLPFDARYDYNNDRLMNLMDTVFFLNRIFI